MSMFKGTAYAGQLKNGFGGTAKESQQPKSGWSSPKTYGSNMGSAGDPPSKKGSMFGKKWTPTCKSCGGKM